MKYSILNKASLLLLAGSLMLNTACKEEFLEVEPSTSVSVDEGLNSPAKLEAFLNGMYDIGSLAMYRNHYLMYNDVKGGDALVIPSGNYNRFPTEYQFVQNPTLSYVSANTWRWAYQLIANANLLIENVPSVALDDAVKNRYLAEARALRGMAHFDLVKMFSKPYATDPQSMGIPVSLEPLGPDDEVPPRGTVQDVYNAIVADLLFAEANIGTGATNKAKMTLGAVQGWLARVYLHMENWPKAAEYAEKAIASNPGGLMTVDQWKAGFADPTSEWIQFVGHTPDDNNGYLANASFWDWRTIGYSNLATSSEFINIFSATDFRKQLADTYGAQARANGGRVTTKFVHRSAWDMEQVVMRESEMYLIWAEALANMPGNEALAQDKLFIIQSRADALAVKSINTGEALLNEIYNERRKELFGEGFRYEDLQRLGLPLVRTAAGNHWQVGTIAADDYRRIEPIPQAERDVSDLPQNPGYNN